MKTKYYVAILAAILIFCAVLTGLLLSPGTPATHATVTSGGKEIRTVDLRVNQEFTVTLEDGSYNTITVKDGAVAVTDASCPDHYCAKRGFCSGGAQIVCLPNGLVISFSGEPEIDAAVG
jgi:hypothetical protein